MSASDTLIERVRKLLALAESPNENEAALAAEKAQELMLRYGIELAQVAASKGESVKVDKETIHGKLDPWRRVLASAVARSMGGNCVIGMQPRKWSGHIDFWGERGVAAAAAALYQYLEAQVTAISVVEAIKYKSTQDRLTAASSMRWRKSFCLGMVDRIADRLEERKEAMEVESEAGNALAVIKTAVEPERIDQCRHGRPRSGPGCWQPRGYGR